MKRYPGMFTESTRVNIIEYMKCLEWKIQGLDHNLNNQSKGRPLLRRRPFDFLILLLYYYAINSISPFSKHFGGFLPGTGIFYPVRRFFTQYGFFLPNDTFDLLHYIIVLIPTDNTRLFLKSIKLKITFKYCSGTKTIRKSLSATYINPLFFNPLIN